MYFQTCRAAGPPGPQLGLPAPELCGMRAEKTPQRTLKRVVGPGFLTPCLGSARHHFVRGPSSLTAFLIPQEHELRNCTESFHPGFA